MSEEAPPTLFGKPMVYTDKKPAIGHDGEITLIPVSRAFCVKCGVLLRRIDDATCVCPKCGGKSRL